MSRIIETNFLMLNTVASQDPNASQNLTRAVDDLIHAGYKLLN
jgi:hypothetical protein